MKALLAACKPLILLDFHRSFNDTRTKSVKVERFWRIFLLLIKFYLVLIVSVLSTLRNLVRFLIVRNILLISVPLVWNKSSVLVSPRWSYIFFLIDISVVIFCRIKYNKAHNNQTEYHKQEGVRMNLTELMQNPYAWAILSVCTIAAFIFAIYTWFVGKKKKEISYVYSTYEIIKMGNSVIPGVQLLYHGKDIADLTITRYAIWNSGNEVLNSTDIVATKQQWIVKLSATGIEFKVP